MHGAALSSMSLKLPLAPSDSNLVIRPYTRIMSQSGVGGSRHLRHGTRRCTTVCTWFFYKAFRELRQVGTGVVARGLTVQCDSKLEIPTLPTYIGKVGTE